MALLSLRRAAGRSDAARDHPLSDGGRADGGREASSPTDPSRPDRPAEDDAVDRVRDDGQAGRGAPAELLRTKADRSAVVHGSRDLKANSSNDTVLPTIRARSPILHPQFVPRRDDRFDYTKPVDGSDPRTDWTGFTPSSFRTRSTRRPAGPSTATTGSIRRPDPIRRSPRISPPISTWQAKLSHYPCDAL